MSFFFIIKKDLMMVTLPYRNKFLDCQVGNHFLISPIFLEMFKSDFRYFDNVIIDSE